jgi:phenylalanyl-tRNA synthetase beta chain
MKTSLSWLKTHLDTDATIDEIVARLVMLGHDVDGVEDPASALADFRIARVVSAVQHPNADRLRVCVVDAGEGEIQVVCGAPNARAGMKGVFGRAGVTVPRNGKKLEESTIRGVASRGMLMSAWELALSDDHEGIIDLPDEAPVGTRYIDYAGLGDPVIDIKVTPNRADCLGVRGLARDLAAAGVGRLKPLDTTPVPGRFTSPIGISLTDRTDARCFSAATSAG